MLSTIFNRINLAVENLQRNVVDTFTPKTHVLIASSTEPAALQMRSTIVEQEAIVVSKDENLPTITLLPDQIPDSSSPKIARKNSFLNIEECAKICSPEMRRVCSKSSCGCTLTNDVDKSESSSSGCCDLSGNTCDLGAL
jgi:hypothetical protein